MFRCVVDWCWLCSSFFGSRPISNTPLNLKNVVTSQEPKVTPSRHLAHHHNTHTVTRGSITQLGRNHKTSSVFSYPALLQIISSLTKKK